MKHLMSFFFVVLSSFSIFFSSCSKEDLTPETLPISSPTASFSVDNITTLVGETITFTNQSDNATSYEWDFGDGNISTDENPDHSYSDAGSFTVKLTAKENGAFNSTSKTITVTHPETVADFTMDKSMASTGETITFTNTSQHATSYLWDFGDGNTSTDENPTHAYLSDGNYNIALTATGNGGESTTTKSISIETNYDGVWKATTTQNDSQLSSAKATFTIDGNSVSISSWSVSTNIGFFFGSNWSATLATNNSFIFSPQIGNLTFDYSISLESSTSGIGIFTYNGQNYTMEVTRQ